MTRLWLRAPAEAGKWKHVMLGGAVLAPGQAVELDPANRAHAAVVRELEEGRDGPLELVECSVDPSLPVPPDHRRELVDARAQRAAAVERKRQALDPTWQRPLEEEPEHADAAVEHAAKVRVLERRLRAEALAEEEALDRDLDRDRAVVNHAVREPDEARS